MTNKVKIAISIFSITVIIACLIQAYPKYRQLQEILQDTTEVNVSDDLTAVTDETIYDGSGESAEESNASDADYIATQDYEDLKNRIYAVKERTNLLNNDIISDLTDITKLVFNKITEISAKPEEDELKNYCEQYMTSDFYEKFKEMEFERESYMVYDIEFSDLDKENITAYVLTRSSRQYRFFITYSFEESKNFVISDIRQIIQKG